MPTAMTDVFVAKLKPGTTRQDIHDAKARGLVLRVTPKGVKSWSLMYVFEGQKRRLTLGEYPDLKLADAREQVDIARGRIAKGEDPAREKAKARIDRQTALTFEALAAKWLEHHARAKLKPMAVRQRGLPPAG